MCCWTWIYWCVVCTLEYLLIYTYLHITPMFGICVCAALLWFTVLVCWNVLRISEMRRFEHLISWCQFTGSCNLSYRFWLSQYVQRSTLSALHLRPSGVLGCCPSDLEFTAGWSAGSGSEFWQLIFSAFQHIRGVSCVDAFGKFSLMLTLTLCDYTVLWSVLLMTREIY